MPLYSYYCKANDETVQVIHRMSARIETWGALCEVAGQPLGGTRPDAPVSRMIARVQVSSSGAGATTARAGVAAVRVAVSRRGQPGAESALASKRLV